MNKAIARYLTLAIVGALVGPFLYLLFAAWGASHYNPNFGTSTEILTEMFYTVMTNGELWIVLTLGMPSGALIFVILGFLFSFVSSLFPRTPHSSERSTIDTRPKATHEVTDTDDRADDNLALSVLSP